MNTSGKVTVSIRLPEELADWIRDEAELREATLSAVVERAVRAAQKAVEE
jgi:Arc/MetJ-type ribon-helix-helix transcriptional regulator